MIMLKARFELFNTVQTTNNLDNYKEYNKPIKLYCKPYYVFIIYFFFFFNNMVMSTCLLESKCANENNGSVEEVEGECLVECVVHNQRKG